jgi:nitrilase
VAAIEAFGDGPAQRFLAETAEAHGIWLVGGTIPIRDGGGGERASSRSLLVGPDGRVVAHYDKIHLFDVDIPGGATLRESDATAGGDSLVVVDIDGAKVGLSICYDVRFPELYRALVCDRGAEVLMVPAAFTAHTGAAHWHLMLRARAVEDQAWVVAPAQWGKHNDKRESYGHTLVVDPWGAIAGEQAEGDGVVMATLDGATVAKRRTQMPCLRHIQLR